MLTESGPIVGTVGYMSPEQVRSEEVDNRSDLWSLGAMAYEMITGVLPFEESNRLATLNSILDNRSRPIDTLREGVPSHLEILVERLLCKKPEERVQSAAEVLRTLSGASSSA